jgi:hypothetical protein
MPAEFTARLVLGGVGRVLGAEIAPRVVHDCSSS